MRESVIEKAFVQRIKRLGGEIRKVQWPGRRGAPDRAVFGVPGHPLGPTIWVELKRPGEKPCTHQEREHARLRNAQQIVLVIDTLELIDRHFPLENNK